MTITIDDAVRLLLGGEVVALPTETVYGLAALATDEAAIAKVFALKGRPADNPLIVHVASLDQLALVAIVPATAERLVSDLVESYWPGPLTLVLPATERVPLAARARLPTVAVRMPDHPLTRLVIERAGPVVAPSANPSGRPSPVSAAQIACALPVPILDGGPCRVGFESTIVTVDPPRLLRPGSVTLEELREFAPFTLGDDVIAPGMKHRHYSPRTKLVAFAHDADLRAALAPGIAVITFGADYPAPTIAATPESLFTVLHDIDSQSWDAVYVLLPPATGIWRAIRNRLEKAAHSLR